MLHLGALNVSHCTLYPVNRRSHLLRLCRVLKVRPAWAADPLQAPLEMVAEGKEREARRETGDGVGKGWGTLCASHTLRGH